MKMKRFKTLLLMTGALAVAAGAFSPAYANPFVTRLENGLTLIVKEDRRAPTAVHMVWYRVGSVDESDGYSGVAHLLEHMMFKGTPAVGGGEFSKRVAAAGGRDNAFTSRDYTAYFQQVPSDRLDEMMQLEADRMRHLTLDPEEFAQELKVVMEERRMRTEDDPHALLYEQFNAASFIAHPYHRPIIGWMNDLENMTVADARNWYDNWYVPNNAYVLVVGDVDHQEVFRMVKEHYGAIEAKPLPERKPQEEPQQRGTRRVVVKAPAELPLLLMGYKVPKVVSIDGDAEPFALMVLAGILDGHDSARLPKQLVKTDRIAISVSADYGGTSRGPELFYLSGMPAPGHDVAEIEAALRAQIDNIRKNGVEEAELARVKTQLVSSQIYKRDSMFAQAMEIGRLEAVGLSYRDMDRIIERIKAIGAGDVQAVAKKYFSEDDLTVAVLEPQPAEPAPAAVEKAAENTERKDTDVKP